MNNTKLKEYEEKKKVLFEKWLKRYNANGGNISFAIDGIVSPETWFGDDSSGEKILILLKEAYSTDGDYIWDLSKWLSHTRCNSHCKQEDCSICHITGYTYNAVAEYIFAIIESSKGTGTPYDGNLHSKNKDYYKTRDALFLNASILNIKKASGRKRSSYSELIDTAKKDSDLIKEQIELIAPTTIVCGGTYDMLKAIYPSLPKLENSLNGCAKLDDIKIIATCHPNARKNREERYNKIVQHYKNIKE